MATKAQFLKHSIIFGIGGTLSQLAPLILLPLYTNYLTTTEYGIMDVIYQATLIIDTVFLVSGIRLATLTFYKQAENEELRRRIAVTVSLMLWFVIAAAVGFCICFADWVDYFLKIGDKKLLIVGMSVALMEGLTSVPMTLMQGRLESVRCVLTSWSMMFCRIGLCVYFVAFLRWGIWGVFFSQGLVVIVFGTLLSIREFMIGSLIPDTKKWKEICKFCFPLVPNGMLAFINGMSGRFMVLTFSPYPSAAVTLGMLGLFALASRLIGFSSFFGAGPLSKVWNVEMYEVYKKPYAEHEFGLFALRMMCVAMFGILFVCLFAGEGMRIIADPSYYDAVWMVPIFAVNSYIATFCTQMYSTYFITRNTKMLFWVNLMLVPFTLGFVAALVPLWGVTGAALAAVLTTFVNAVLSYRTTQRLFKVEYPFGKIMFVFITAALCYALGLWCDNAVTLGNLPVEEIYQLPKLKRLMYFLQNISYLTVLLKCGILALWCAVIWNSSVLTKEDKTFAVRSVRKVLKFIPGKI